MSKVIKILACLTLGWCAAGPARSQEFLPAPPADRTLVYVLDQQNKLVPLPVETATTPLPREAVAKSTKLSYVEIKGEHSPASWTRVDRLFLFTVEQGGAHPPLLVWLTPRHGARRVTAIAEQGRAGFAISAEEIIKPTARGLAKEGDVVFMELRPRVSLMPGEYAIIGGDLTRVATFRVVATSP